jgi:hypothetical protein
MFVGDNELLDVPVAVMVHVVDFGVYLDDSKGCDRVLAFLFDIWVGMGRSRRRSWGRWTWVGCGQNNLIVCMGLSLFTVAIRIGP